MSNKEKFLDLYKKFFEENVKNNPSQYLWYPNVPIETVYNKMAKAIVENSFNKDSPTIKAVCKDLNIKHTYSAIQEYLEG